MLKNYKNIIKIYITKMYINIYFLFLLLICRLFQLLVASHTYTYLYNITKYKILSKVNHRGVKLNIQNNGVK